VATESSELLALTLELEASGAEKEHLITTLIDESHGSPTQLLGACALAQSLTRTLPLDPTAQDAYGVLVESLRWVTRHPGARAVL
jgi:hypothetical protein